MANLHDTLKSLMIAAGIDVENFEEAKTLLSNKAITEVEVPDGVRGVIMNNLMTVESAKNNQKVSDHFRHVHLSGIDSKIETLLSELEVPDEVKAEILKEQKTHQKMEALKNKVRELYERKDKSKVSKEATEQKIAELNNEILTLKNSIPSIRLEEQAKFNSMLESRDLDSLFSKMEYGIDLPKDVLIQTARGLVDKKLADSKYKRGYDPQSSSFRLLTDTDMEVFQENKPVTFADFATKVLADSKMLKATGTPNPAPAPQSQPIQVQRGRQGVDHSAIAQEMAAQAAEINN